MAVPRIATLSALALAAAGASIASTSAFRPPSQPMAQHHPSTTASSSSSPSSSSSSTALLAAHYYNPYPPFPYPAASAGADPYFNYNMMYNPYPPFPPPPFYNNNNNPHQPRPQQQRPYPTRGYPPHARPSSPRYLSALDAEVITDNDEYDERAAEEDEWRTDRQRVQMARSGNEGDVGFDAEEPPIDLPSSDDDAGEEPTQQQQQQRRRTKHGEVINFDPEHPTGTGGYDDNRPLRSAATHPSDMYEDENKFMGRKPGQPVNRDDNNLRNDRADENENDGGGFGVEGNGRDPREQHVLLDEYGDYANNFFRPPLPPPGPPGAPPPYPPSPPPLQRRGGPKVYTREEEELIRAMGGRAGPGGGPGVGGPGVGGPGVGGPASTQEFAGLGTMKKNVRAQFARMPHNDMPLDPQRRNYNPEQNYNPDNNAVGGGLTASSQNDEFLLPPPPPMGDPYSGAGGLRQEGYLGDSTLKEISLDYSIPIPYLADVLATWGVPVPIDPQVRLGDMVTGEQAFAILEAIHTLDIASLHDRYSEETLLNICDYYDVDVKDAFEFCVQRGWALPFGVRTFLRVEQEEEMLDVLA